MSDHGAVAPAHAAAGVTATSRGIWTSTGDVDLLRRLGASGFDWLAVDAQHGPVDRVTLHAIGRAFDRPGPPFLVRVPAVDPAWIGAALDSGATAVRLPSRAGVAGATGPAPPAPPPPPPPR